MRQKAISARINQKVLEYIKGCHQPVNSLINTLLEQWMRRRQEQELLLFQEETGTDELSQLAERHTESNSQCCNNCNNLVRYNGRCFKTQFLIPNNQLKKYCCIYWEKKKERK